MQTTRKANTARYLENDGLQERTKTEVHHGRNR